MISPPRCQGSPPAPPCAARCPRRPPHRPAPPGQPAAPGPPPCAPEPPRGAAPPSRRHPWRWAAPAAGGWAPAAAAPRRRGPAQLPSAARCTACPPRCPLHHPAAAQHSLGGRAPLPAAQASDRSGLGCPEALQPLSCRRCWCCRCSRRLPRPPPEALRLHRLRPQLAVAPAAASTGSGCAHRPGAPPQLRSGGAAAGCSPWPRGWRPPPEAAPQPRLQTGGGDHGTRVGP